MGSVRVAVTQLLLLVVMAAALAEVRAASRYYSNGCYTQRGRGLRLQSHNVDKYITVNSQRDCERACDIAFFSCKSFSYSDYREREKENCLLSRDDSRTLDIRGGRDFYEDNDFNYYEKSRADCSSSSSSSSSSHYYGRHNYAGNTYQHILVEEAHGSGTYSGGSQYWSGSGSRPGTNWYWGSGGSSCYDLVKTRERISRHYIIRGKVLKTRDRRECEAECDRERLCLGFNYRFKTQGDEQYRDNCELSSQDASSYLDFNRDEDFDFYEKNTKSRDCYQGGTGYHGSGSGSYGSGSYGSGSYGSGSYGSGSGSYGSGSYGSGSYGTGSRSECFRLVQTEAALEGRVVRDSFTVRDIRECERECERSRRYTCKTFSFRYQREVGRRENCFLSDEESRDIASYNLVRERESDFYERRLYGRECSVDTTGSNDYYYQSGRGDTVVTGVRCYRDRCREDRQGGYFYCETDHSGAWDYCCRPNERCGYSEDYPTPWCYVGSRGRDQWRPCNNQGRDRDYLHEGPHPDAGKNLTTETPPTTSSVEVLDLNVA